MRKILRNLLCLLCILLPLYARAATVDSGSCGDNVMWTLSSDGVLTISGSGPMSNYEAIWLETEKAYTFETPWYSEYADDIRMVVVDSGVTSIGSNAFADLDNLISVEIASTVSSLGEQAFWYCDRLSSVAIPVQISELSDYAFAYCTELSNAYLPESLQKIGNNAFFNCTLLTQISIPGHVTEIGHGAFEKTGLTSVVVPDSVKKMESSVFAYCTKLKSAVLPAGLETIRSYMFIGCTSLTSVTMPERLRVIESDAFRNCSELTSITLGSVLTEIEEYAFSDSALTSIEFPETLTWIGVYAFSDCDGLTSVKFNGPAPVVIGDEAFEDVAATVAYPGSSASWTEAIRENYGGTLTWQPYSGTVQDTAIIRGTCGAELTWSLSNGELRISGMGFMDDYQSTMKSWYGTTVSDAPWGKYVEGIRSVVVENGVLSIGDYAFQHCINLSSISLPSSIASYGEGCFGNCESLPSFVLPYGARSVPDHMFSSCTALQSVTLPETIVTIEANAFSYCESLTSIHLPDSLKEIGWNAFRGSGLTSIELPDSVTTLANGAFATCFDLTSVKLGKSLTTISEYCFEDCTNLSSITIPGTIREIKSTAFALWESTVEFMQPCAKTFTFEGSMPEIAEDALLRSTATIRYPYSNADWKNAASAKENYGGTVTWQSYYPDDTIANCIIQVDYTPEFYTGKAIVPRKVTVTYGGNVLTEGEHYRLTYANNVNAGTAKVSVVGMGSFSGTVTRTYSILKKPAQMSFKSSTVNVKANAAAFTHPLTAVTDGKITYTSVDENVAVVNSTTGQITVIGVGSTYIYANAAEGTNYKAASARFYLTVEEAYVANPLIREDVAFKFTNSYSAFGYSSNYRIPLERYMNMYAEVEARARYNNAGLWGGNCYGMSAVAGLFSMPGGGLSLAQFGKDHPYSITPTAYSSALGMNLREVIETMQVSWGHNITTRGYQGTRDDIAGLIAELDRARYTRQPVVVAVYSDDGAAHALLAYDYEKVSSTLTLIHIYDVNYSREARSIRITTDAQGNCLKWFYSINDRYNCGTDYDGSYFIYLPYTVYSDVWNARLTRDAIVNDSSLFIDVDNFEIRDRDGALVAFMKNGVFTSYVQEIYQFVPVDSSYYAKSHLIYLPTEAYRIINLDDEAMTITMVNRHQSAVITTTAKDVTLDVSDFWQTNMVYINGKAGDSYSLTLESSLECAQKMKLLEFRGTITRDARVELGTINGELFVANCDEIAIWNNGVELGNAVTEQQQRITDFDVTLDYTQCVYTGEKCQPAVYVRNGSYELQEHRDFFVIYANDTNVGMATAAIYGLGSYGGVVYREYEILPASASSCLGGHAWNQGTILPSVDQSTESCWYQTCMVCGQTRQEVIPGYNFRLEKATAGEVVVSLTNTMEKFIRGTLCVMVYDSKNQQIASGAQVVSLGRGRTAELKLTLTSSETPAFICCSVVDTKSLAPMCTSILTCLTAESKEQQKYVVMVEASAGGTVAQDVGMYYPGTKLTLNAIPDAGYAFDHWEATAGTIESPYQPDTAYVVPDQHATVVAVFTPQPMMELPATGDGDHPLLDTCLLLTSGVLLLWVARKKRLS